MSGKLYYEDELAAAYMCKHFGITFKTDYINTFKNTTYDTVEEILANNGPFYIQDSCKNVFKPVVGDVIKIIQSNYACDRHQTLRVRFDDLHHYSSDQCEVLGVIERDRKQFFIPRECAHVEEVDEVPF